MIANEHRTFRPPWEGRFTAASFPAYLGKGDTLRFGRVSRTATQAMTFDDEDAAVEWVKVEPVWEES